MLSAEPEFTRYVGTAPGTTAFTFRGSMSLSQPPLKPRTQALIVPTPVRDDVVEMALPEYQAAWHQGRTEYGPGGPSIPPSPTQAWVDWSRHRESGPIRLVLPSNQHATTPLEVKIDEPPWQNTMGPFPNDRMLAPTRSYGNMAVTKGWIETKEGNIYTLQGPEEEETRAEKEAKTARNWAIFASVTGSLALATTAIIAVLRWRAEK